jgi:hypothetical protein
MEISEVEDQECQDEDPAPVHYSTGRLTRGQAALVNTWRARLLLDRPLPGRRPVGEVARLLGLDNRPPASCSDIIAAAVTDLLRQGSDELGLARYAHAGWQAQQAAARRNGYNGSDDDKAPLYPPVSFYLGGALATQYEALRAPGAGGGGRAALPGRSPAGPGTGQLAGSGDHAAGPAPPAAQDSWRRGSADGDRPVGPPLSGPGVR